MTNKKSTKKALLLSVLSLLLCCSMLIGTTFAWFTDSVTSGNNKIVAGNLDVKLTHANKTDAEEEVNDTVKLFNEVTLWEPGAMVWEKLTVSNEGTLALEYTLKVNAENFTTVNNHSLAEVLKVAVLDEQPTRDNIKAATLNPLGSFILESEEPLLTTQADTFYVAIYWEPTDHDNDFNVPGEALSVELGVTLVATQYTHEDDSFDNQYDADADTLLAVSTPAALISALERGENVKLVADIDLSSGASNGNFEIPAAAGKVTIDLNGYTLTAPAREGYNGRTQYAFDNYADLTLTGNGTIKSRGIQNYGKLTINDGVTIEAVDTNGGACIWAYDNSETIINGGTFTAAENAGCITTSGKLTVNGGTFTQTQSTAGNYCYVINFNGTEGVIRNATVTGDHGAVAVTAGNLTIQNGTFTCSDYPGQSDHVVYISAGSLTINGGKYIGSTDAGGKCVWVETGSQATINAGTFNIAPDAAILADGCSLNTNADGTFSVVRSTAANLGTAASVEIVVRENTSATASALVSAVVPAAAVEDVNAPIEVIYSDTDYEGNFAIEYGHVTEAQDITVTNLKPNNTEPIKLSLTIPAGLDPATVKLYHYDELIPCTYNPNTGVVSFETTDFSPFTVVYDAQSEYVAPEIGEDTEAPKATVEYKAEYVNTELPWGNFGQWSPDYNVDANPMLEAAYVFSCVETPEQAQNNPYANWYCDFYVMLDKDLGSNQIFLGGNYGSFGWVGFHNGDVVLDANTEIGLLESVTTNPWTYLDVAQYVGTFICGVGDVNDALEGATFTVMLRLTNPEDSTDFVNVATINYTFE